MTLILGLDIATTTGFALYSLQESLSTIKTGTIVCKGNNAEQKAASLSVELIKLLKAHKPDFIAIEEPLRNLVPFRKKTQSLMGEEEHLTINPSALQLSSMTGAAVAITSGLKIPWTTIPSQTWRKHFLGRGREKGWKRSDWKRAAIERCRLLHIPVKNNDAAEAVGIAIAGSASQEFKALGAKQKK